MSPLVNYANSIGSPQLSKNKWSDHQTFWKFLLLTKTLWNIIEFLKFLELSREFWKVTDLF